MNSIFKVFICEGEYESGGYTVVGKNYVDAATNFANHSNVCLTYSKYGDKWKLAGKIKGNPKHHNYLTDNKGNKLLLIDTHEKTTYNPAIKAETTYSCPLL